MIKENEFPVLYEGKEDYLFISYSHNSKINIYKILKQLNSLGIRFWYDKGLEKGVDWKKHVEQKMLKSACVLFFFDVNFFSSISLQKEVEIVIKNNLKHCPIYYEGLNYQKLSRTLPMNFDLDEDVDELFRKLFNNKITSIFNYPEKQSAFYQEISDLATKYKCISQKNVTNVISKTKKIAYVAKDSIFSRSIGQGIEKVFSSSQHIINSFLLKDNYLSYEIAFTDTLNKLIKSDYDGVIIRPLGSMNEKTFSVFKQLCEQKNVVLCDIDISNEQRNKISKIKQPSYICSDFEIGGKKIATIINQICFNKSYFDSDVVVCVGPTNSNPARIRSESLLNNLSRNKNIVPHQIYLSSLNPRECFKKISDFYSKNAFSNIKNRTLIIYLGNDNVVLNFAKNIHEIKTGKYSLDEYKNIFVIGYDGIIGTTGNSVLEEAGFDYATIDTLPFEQGRQAALKLIEELENKDKCVFVKATPKVIKKINLMPSIENKLSSIENLIDNADFYIMDLDGTIADTETYHWKAYNVLLKDLYGITLSVSNIKKYIGNNEISIYRMIEKDFNISINDEEFLKNRLNVYLNLLEADKLEPFKWLKDFVRKYNNKKVALLSSQVPNVINHLLTLWDLDDVIPLNYRVSTHDGKHTKKEFFANPELFVNISKDDLGNVVVFEDSNHVIDIASNYGYTTIGISHKLNKGVLKDCITIIDENIKKGLFVGLAGIDVYYHINKMPTSDSKIKTNDYGISVGGPALKAAITCSKLGGNATLITGVGDGPLSYEIKSECDKYHIELIDIMPDKKLPNISFVGINNSLSTRDIVSGQTVSDNCLNIPDNFYKKFDYCLYDCNFPFFTEELVEHLKLFNIPLVLDCGSWKSSIEKALLYSTFAISSAGFKSLENKDIFDLQEKYEIKYVAKTKGGNPIDFCFENKKSSISITKKNNVNTLGAGDVFHGAFCFYKFDLNEDFESSLKKASNIASSYLDNRY